MSACSQAGWAKRASLARAKRAATRGSRRERRLGSGRARAVCLCAAMIVLVSPGCAPPAASGPPPATAESEQLAGLRQRLELAERRATTAEQQRDEQSSIASRAEYELAVVEKERDNANELLEQLRADLDRTADHLRTFSTQKKELAIAVTQLEARLAETERMEAENKERAQVLRDLAVELSDAVRSAAVDLTVIGGTPVLRLLTGVTDGQLDAASSAALAKTAKIMSTRPRVFEIRSKDDAVAEAVAAALRAAGVDESRIRRMGEPETGAIVDIALERQAPPAAAGKG